MLPKSLFNVFSSTLTAFRQRKYRKSVVEKIDSRTQPNLLYYALLGSATVIAVLGLLINNVIIVIGAMIIAPLYWPMVGVALGIAAANYKILKRSILMMVGSVALSLSISFLIASFVPSGGSNELIRLTSSSDVLHLLVAAASALGGVIAIYSPIALGSLVGVTVSLSLLPPLAAAGLGLAQGSGEIFWGGSRLLGVNIVVVIFVGALTFLAFKIRSKNKHSRRFELALVVLGLILLLIAVPLTSSFRQYQAALQEKESIQQQIRNSIASNYPEVELFELKLEPLNEQADAWRARVILLVPETSLLDGNNLGKLEDKIEQNLTTIVLFNWRKVQTQSL